MRIGTITVRTLHRGIRREDSSSMRRAEPIAAVNCGMSSTVESSDLLNHRESSIVRQFCD